MGKISKGQHLKKIQGFGELPRPNMREVEEKSFMTRGGVLIREAKEAYLITHIPFMSVVGGNPPISYGLLAIRASSDDRERTVDDFTLLTMTGSSGSPYTYERELCRRLGIDDVLEPEVHGGEVSPIGKEPEIRIYRLR